VFQSVTAYGRNMIEQTKQEVEQHYNIENGYQHDAQVWNNTTSIPELKKK
jgi:DNA polymerase delta subunit 1